MRRLSLIALTLLTLAGCQGGSSSPTATSPQPVAGTTLTEVSTAAFPQLVDDVTGSTSGVLGVYTLATSGDAISLEPVRIAAGQGDTYSLSVRPFMSGPDLRLTSTVAVDADTNEYTLRFTHPFDMPADIERPATAQKRLDLFLFDTQLVFLTPGDDRFFDDEVITNLELIENPSGYRPIEPLVDLDLFGVGDTNVFPYALLRPTPGSTLRGNYDEASGWTDEEFLTATGYDVIRQGRSASVAVRAPKSLTGPLTLLVVARYMDPRGGSTPDDQRANRLPDPADPAALRYYLPEACGDLQSIAIDVQGSLLDNRSTDKVTVTATVLDWDNSATVASTFPDPVNPTHIARTSGPTGRALDVPALRANLHFPMTEDRPATGELLEQRQMVFEVWNADQQLDIPLGESMTVQGFFRCRDTQDAGGVHYTILNEELQPQAAPALLLPSTRYQRVDIEVASGKALPVVTGVSPLVSTPGSVGNFAATTTGQTPTGWTWNFGGGATPNTSSQAEPQVLFGGIGAYSGSVLAKSIYGDSEVFTFDYEVSNAPVIQGVLPTGEVGFSGTSRSFTLQLGGAPATAWEWNFGGGASPNARITASPTVTLGAAGDYTGYVTVSNAFGSNGPFAFDFAVQPASAPELSNVQPTGNVGIVGAQASFTVDATNSPTTWSWNFGGGAIPNTPSAVSPTVTLATAGTFNGSVQVGNLYGNNSLPFSYTIQPAPTAPVVTFVNPTGGLGPEGTVVMFEALATQTPTSWNWNFDGGAVPNISNQAEPTVTLGAMGTYTGTVAATNAIGTSAPFPFEFIVSPPTVPTVQSVMPTGSLGLTGESVEFSGVATNSPTGWSWNFGGGASPNTSTSTTPNVTLGTPGLYEGTVTATNAGGASAVFEFTYRVRAMNPPGRMWQWDSPSSASRVYITSAVEDGSGDVYLVGQIHDDVDLDPGPASQPFTVTGANAIALMKFDAAGNYIFGLPWETTSDGSMSPTEIIRDASGNLVICGYFGGTVDLDPTVGVNLQSAGATKLFVVSLTPTGGYRWAGVSPAETSMGLVRLPNDRLLLAGQYSGTVDFQFGIGSQNRTAAGGSDVYALEMTADGEYVEVQTFGSVMDEDFTNLKLAADGSRQITGSFSDFVDFDPGPGVAQLFGGPIPDGFLLKLSDTGTYGWARKLVTTDYVTYPKLVVRPTDGALLLFDRYRGTIDFDPGAGTVERTATDWTHYQLLLTSTGEFAWVATGVALSPLLPRADGSFIGVTSFSSPLTVPGYPTLEMLAGNGAIIPLSESGVYGQPRQFANPSTTLAWGPRSGQIRSDGRLYILGFFRNTFDANPSPSEDELFVPTNNPGWVAGFQLRLTADGYYD